MITIINYGLGNIGAFANIYKRMNIPFKIATQADDLQNTTHIILPGVGAFDHAMSLLNNSGMREPLIDLVQGNGIPVLGICVGMQILADSSDEGETNGLGWIKGRVRAFSGHPAAAPLPMPHMGWNDVTPVKGEFLFKNLEQEARFYFLHSYYFECAHESDVAASTQYGVSFACAVHQHNMFGVQFHPEKSHYWGATLLKNFSEI